MLPSLGAPGSPVPWLVAGLLASLVVVAASALLAGPGERRVDGTIRLLVASMAPFCLGLFGAMLLPLNIGSPDSAVSLVRDPSASFALRATIGLLAALPLFGAAAVVAVVRGAGAPGRAAAPVFQQLAVVLVVATAAEISFLDPSIQRYPAHVITVGGPVLAVVLTIASFFRRGWERLAFAAAAVLFGPAPFVGQLVALDASQGFERPGSGFLLVGGLLCFGLGIGLALAMAPLASRGRSSPPWSVWLVGLWAAGLAMLVAAGAAALRFLPRAAAPARMDPAAELDHSYHPPQTNERYPPSAWVEGSLAANREPWPSRGPWTDLAGDGPFSLVIHGVEPQLFPVDRDLYVAIHPRLYRALGARLVPLPAPPQANQDIYEDMWKDASDRVALWVDRPHGYGNPSEAASFLVLKDDAWAPAPELRATRTGGDDTATQVIRFAGGRRLLIDKAGPRWASGEDPAPDLGPPGAEACKQWWKWSFVVAIDGDDTYVANHPCARTAGLFRVARDGTVTQLPPPPIADTWVTGLHAFQGRVVIIGSCSRAPKSYGNENCIFRLEPPARGAGVPDARRFEGATWSDEGTQLDGMDLAGTAMSGDGTIWALLAHDGNGATGLFRPRGPVPSGELYRRSPDGHWEKILFPLRPLPGWDCVRFAPIRLALAGDTPWISGKWYYVRKPRPDVVETFVYGGLFRLGAADEPARSMYPADLRDESLPR